MILNVDQHVIRPTCVVLDGNSQDVVDVVLDESQLRSIADVSASYFSSFLFAPLSSYPSKDHLPSHRQYISFWKP
jgi:hypothetical protein